MWNPWNFWQRLLGTEPAKEDVEAPEAKVLKPFPEGLKRTTWPEFASRWGNYLGHLMFPSRRQLKHTIEQQSDLALSLKISRILNHLDRPFALISILFSLWLILDLFLWLFIDHDVFLQIRPMMIALAAPLAIGYATNWLAIKMLFHPKHKNPVWQGLIPAKRKELVEAIADGVLNRLISPDIVREYLHKSDILKRLIQHISNGLSQTSSQPEFRKELKGLIYLWLEEVAQSDLTKEKFAEIIDLKIREWSGQEDAGEVLATFMKGWWGPKLKKQLLAILPELPKALDAVLDTLDGALDKLVVYVEEDEGRLEMIATKALVEGLHSLDLRQIIVSQLEKMNEAELEELLTGNVVSELVFIQVVGGIFGLVVGMSLIWPEARLILFIFLCFVAWQIRINHPDHTKNKSSA